ncbi:alpha/beta fold hydrolase [Natronospira bacteriovora]|uniref:Alpha/beta hydrolase n=1 Tax=Natronospira bacteriovora TaxID=3069753 RepID=A0ABU0W3R4_9GAMM|nr:alpha/beta hydrolase [Natronospira sp. AB-CW4]MDQ2068662.1 alpha/beta hydrolase [Natronospira sp. AB-CW4]
MKQECTFSRGRTRLFYRRWQLPGDRQTLLMCHGLASNGTRWSEFAEATVTEREWNIFCPDLRGHGGSAVRGRINLDIWADDIAALLDAEGVEQAVVGGHCLGANLALHFARRYPDRCKGLVLVEPMFAQALGGVLGRVRKVRYLLPLLAGVILPFNKLGLYRRQLPSLDLTELDIQSRRAVEEAGDPSAITGRYAKPGKDMFYMPSAAYLQSLNQVLKPMKGLEQIQAPALALLSSGGLFGDPPMTRQLLGQLPRVTIDEIDALHWIPTEQPVAMRQHIEAWLDALGERG